jgi:hypothetical protein
MTQENYSDMWADLPLEYGMGQRARQWKRGRTWRVPGGEGRKALLFVREPASPLVVSSAAHERLKGWLGEAAGAWRAVERGVQQADACEFVVQKKKRAPRSHDPSAPKAVVTTEVGWPESLTKRLLNAVRDAAIEDGVGIGSTSWLTRESAAKAAARVLKGFKLGGRPPYLDMAAGLPGALSVRLAAGLNYGFPVTRHDDAWIVLEGIGFARLSTAAKGARIPDRVTEASYVEAAHVDRMWHTRFIFVSEIETEEGIETDE